MAGRRQRWKPLQLLIIFSLLILTNQFEMRDVQEKLSRDVAAELHLRGTSHAETQELLKISESSLINKQLLLHNDKDLDAFLVHLDTQMEGGLVEKCFRDVFPSFRQKGFWF
ncbi:hypothetical protein CRENBAI_010152 [Crenichthys baileyi]|uniref:Uncharacterized protein n=1 Tax=Crenichthys baileyi TaxID=28760 RepID=A0AAV9RS05_9TELE